MHKSILFPMIVVLAVDAFAWSIADPAVAIPGARVAVGASYHCGGYTITNNQVPAIFNRFGARIEFAPLHFVAIGAYAGAAQVDVDRFGTGRDSIPVFHGKFGISGGGNLKCATPLLGNVVGLVAIAQGSYFRSANERNAYYGGLDGAAVAGLQFHIKHFGYLSLGPQFYLIKGTNRSYTGTMDVYSNVNNVRGWMAIDFFPKMHNFTNNKPYISLEFTASPQATFSSRIPVNEYAFSVSIGSITRKLYGVESDVDWDP